MARPAPTVLALVVALVVAWGAPQRRALAFGEQGAFHPRIMLTGTQGWRGLRATGPARWSAELVRRTSAPARLSPGVVRADEPELLAEPFAVWTGAVDSGPLTAGEILGLRRFLALGGVLLVDDADPEAGAFGRAAKRELGRVLPDGSVIEIGTENVIFRSFYLLGRAFGRVAGRPKLEAIVRGGLVQVVFTGHDLLGALAELPGGVRPLEVVPGGERQRELALRLAVNIAMYVLCTNYKDDQVHAPHLMRRRAVE